jgi:hypothetical protein
MYVATKQAARSRAAFQSMPSICYRDRATCKIMGLAVEAVKSSCVLHRAGHLSMESCRLSCDTKGAANSWLVFIVFRYQLGLGLSTCVRQLQAAEHSRGSYCLSKGPHGNCVGLTPYMTVCLVISLPKILHIHRIYMVMANPINASAC